MGEFANPLSCPAVGGERGPKAAPLRTAPPAPAAAEADREDDEEPRPRSGLFDARLPPLADGNGSAAAAAAAKDGDTDTPVATTVAGWGLGDALPVSLPRNIGLVVLNSPWRVGGRGENEREGTKVDKGEKKTISTKNGSKEGL